MNERIKLKTKKGFNESPPPLPKQHFYYYEIFMCCSSYIVFCPNVSCCLFQCNSPSALVLFIYAIVYPNTLLNDFFSC